MVNLEVNSPPPSFCVGSDENAIERADIGFTLPANSYFDNDPVYKGNGGDGITIRGGARHNVIGDSSFYRDLHIFANAGAGIRITGSGTEKNKVMNYEGCDIRV